MKIRVVKSFNGYRVGQVFDWGDGMARVFIARGMVVTVEEKPVERAVVKDDTERATLSPPVKRRKKR